MNLRKIIATAVSAVMLFSAVSVSASFYDDAGWNMTDVYPTAAEVSARQPVVANTVEKILLEEAKTYGITAGRGPSEKTDVKNDFYKVTYTISNFGPLYYACYADGNYDKYAFVKLFDATVTIPGITAVQYVVSGTFNGKAFSSEAATKVIWNAGAIADEYPANSEAGTVDETTTLTATVVYAVAKGYTLNVTPTLVVTYDVKTEDGNPSPVANGTAANNLVFGSAPVVEPGIKADNDGKVETLVTETKKYGIAKFSQTINPAKDYYVYAKDTDNNTNITITDGTIAEKDKAAASKFKIDFGDIKFDTEGNVSFYALIHSTTHTIATMRLIAVNK